MARAVTIIHFRRIGIPLKAASRFFSFDKGNLFRPPSVFYCTDTARFCQTTKAYFHYSPLVVYWIKELRFMKEEFL